MTRSTLSLLKNEVRQKSNRRSLLFSKTPHMYQRRRKPPKKQYIKTATQKKKTNTKKKKKTKTKTNKQKTQRSLSLGINYNNIRKMLLFAPLIRKQTFLNHRTRRLLQQYIITWHQRHWILVMFSEDIDRNIMSYFCTKSARTLKKWMLAGNDVYAPVKPPPSREDKVRRPTNHEYTDCKKNKFL